LEEEEEMPKETNKRDSNNNDKDDLWLKAVKENQPSRLSYS
jgi:hypothetical protein